MTNEKAMYWLMQMVGWFLFIVLILLQNLLSGAVDIGIWKFLVLNFILGIAISHGMRFIILRFGILKLKVAEVIGIVILLSLISGAVATILIFIIQDFLFLNEQNIPLNIEAVLRLTLPFMVVFLIWNILYLAANYLRNYEHEEIKNLRLSASVTEVELMNLRSQLNPHFMFNALNSIRALIDENPKLAKKNITRLSSILRNSLTAGHQTTVALDAEMKIVTDYLDLEKTRFEERLKYRLDIPATLLKVEIPPLLIQTVIENAVKHGIGSRTEGGSILVSAEWIDHEMILIAVRNSGKYQPNQTMHKENTGIGLRNSKRRLKLLYGSRASLEILNTPGGVLCKIILPAHLKHEDHEMPDY